jgi:peptidoglycan hydrolase-like protein with peptidoglycan-binding domain
MIKHATVLAMTLAVVAGCTSGSADGVQIPGAVPKTTIALDASEPDTSTTEPPPETVATTAAPVVEPVVTEPPVTDVATTVPPPVTEAPAPTDPPPAPDEFLRLGDENPEVSIMQLKLVALGYLSAGYTDGLFDRATADGLIEFQGQYGLIVDGVFGPQTDRSLTAAAQSVNVDG